MRARRAGRTWMTRKRGKTLRRRAPSPGAFMGDPLRTRSFSFLVFFALLARTERHARVGRLCDDGRRRRARSWGTHREPGWFLCGLLQSMCSNGTTCPRGKMLRRRAPSQGTFMGDPLRTRSFSFLAFFNPFWPSSVHCLEQSKRRRGTTLRRSSPPTCSGLRASGLGREIIAVSGPHYVRHTFGSGSESLRLGSNCLRRTHIVETEPGAVRIDRADIAPLVRQFASSPVRQRASCIRRVWCPSHQKNGRYSGRPRPCHPIP